MGSKPVKQVQNSDNGSKPVKQVQNSDNNTEIKYCEDDKLILGCSEGSLLEFSIKENKKVCRVVHDFVKFIDFGIFWMAKTPDNKSQFVCSTKGGFRELDISTCEKVNSFNIKMIVSCCVITYDNKYLITADKKIKAVLTKWSVRTKKKLHIWQSGVDQSGVISQSCSQDNKYQLIGSFRNLGIFDLQKHQTLKTINVMSNNIYSMACSRDNQSAFISDWYGNIKIINWKADANSGDDFYFSEDFKIGTRTHSICLTKDEKYLLVASSIEIQKNSILALLIRRRGQIV